LTDIGRICKSTDYVIVSQQKSRKLRTLEKAACPGGDSGLAGRDFAIDEEDALLHAIRTETKSALSDEQITDLICNAMETEQPAATCLKNIQRGE